MSNEMNQLMEVFKQIGELAKNEGKTTRNDAPGVEWEGSKIKLPADPTRMGLREGASWLIKMEDAQSQKVAVVEKIENATPWDGAIALVKACREMFGFTEAKPTPGMFGSQNPPLYISVETAFGETEQIFWGRVAIPGVPGWMQTSVGENRGKVFLELHAETQQKYAEVFKRLAQRTREIVAAGSIYRSKAIKLHLDDDGDMDWNTAPSFLDLRRVDPDQLIFSKQLMDQVETNVFTPLKHADLCRQNKVPLKRGVLLAGPYGTGKTLLASVVAKVAVENGWTYVTVERVTALKAALEFAQLYQPCVVFVEDIDREMAGERTAEMDDILNTIDGVTSKNTEVMVVLTSNHVEKINRAMLRPGRLDAVLAIEPPDAEAAERLIRLYGGRRISKDEGLEGSGHELAGQIPAVIRECVERAKLRAIAARPGEEFTLKDEDVAHAAKTMKGHLALLAEPKPEADTPAERLGKALGDVLNHHLGNGADTGLSAKVSGIHTLVDDLDSYVRDHIG